MAEWGRHNTGSDEAVDDFDNFDPTPYGGGYDIALTFGRPIPPSEETCYPPNAGSSSGSGLDYDRPSYRGSAKPSTYGRRPYQEEASEEQRPYEYGGSGEGGGEYGYEGGRRPQYGYGGEERRSEYDSGYGRRPDPEVEQSYDYGNEERPRPKPYRQEQSYGNEGGYREEEERQEYGGGRSEEYGYGERPRYGQERGEDYNRGGSSDEEKKERRHYRRNEYGDD